MAGSRWTRWLRVGDGQWDSHAPLPRAVVTSTTPPTGRWSWSTASTRRSRPSKQARTLVTALRSLASSIQTARRASRSSASIRGHVDLTLADGTTIEQSIVARHGAPVVALSWRVLNGSRGNVCRKAVLLWPRLPLAASRERRVRFTPESTAAGGLVWRPYDGVPSVHVATNGEYHHQPDWYRNFR